MTPVRVLLVDDNEDAADAIGQILAICGHEVQIAYSPEQALAMAPGFAPDVALLDIGLPGMDGYQLAAGLRKLLAKPPRMIALSGFGRDSDHARSREQGFQAHFTKPAAVEQLLAVIADGGGGELVAAG